MGFSINYVGCKAVMEEMLVRGMNHFLLTMWDVKPIKLYHKNKSSVNFLLTMWDVKLDRIVHAEIMATNFLLTMWDVKCR